MGVRYSKISSSLFKKNRAALLSKMRANSFGLIHSNDLMPRNGDCYFPFRQNSDFFYLTGIDQEESVLLLDPAAENPEDQAILFIKETNEHIKIWEGHKLSKEEACKTSGIQNVKCLEELREVLLEITSKREVFYFNTNQNGRAETIVQCRDERINLTYKDLWDKKERQSFAPLLSSLRVIKSEEEIHLIQRACGITKKTFERVLGFVQPEVWEYEIEAEITHEFTINQANGHAYTPIVASGKNSCILHYIDNNQRCQDGDILLLDFGAEYANYASDLSRTIPVNGRYSKRQKAVYDAAYSVFLFARSQMRPGIEIKDFQSAVVQEMERQLIGLGLFSMNDLKNQKKEEPLYRQYFMHGTSHFMGIDVHDVGDRKQQLEAGMVLTCEPGIYIENEGIGVRIENDILITIQGNVDLMMDIPIESDHIEDLMNR